MILIFCILGIAAARIPCDPGSYADSIDTCEICPSGWFQSIEDALSCIECTNMNQYSDVQGAISCKTCPIGRVRENNRECLDCPDNMVRDESSIACSTCPQGFKRKDNTICVECPVSATELTPCCTGSVMVDGICSACPLGTYIQSPTDTVCTKCPIGKTSNEGQDGCLECPPGSGTNETTKLCVRCPPGTYSYYGVCKECPDNTHQTEYGQTSCYNCTAPWLHHSSSTPCQYNHTCQTGHSGDPCEACPVGQIRTVFQENCTACPGHSIQDGNLCVECPEAQVSENNVCTYCSAGKFRTSGETCNGCLVGQYGVSLGQCQLCAPGKYQDQTGETSCKDCASGRFRATPGGSWCSECAGGSGSSQGSVSCEMCSPGTDPSSGECTDCSAGFFCPSTPLLQSCTFCPGGWIASDSGSESCSICDIGKYSNYNRTICAVCPTGEVTNVDGLGAYGCATSYTHCGAGRYGEAFDCKDCPRGWSSGTHQQTCDECPSGTFATSRSAFCQVCAKGKFSFEGSSCKDCAPGRTSKQGVCEDCAKGKYQSHAGQPECLDCPSARTTTDFGQTSSEACEACESPNQVISSAGLCTWCDQTEYPKDGICISCPQGWDNVLLSSACTKCASGYAATDSVCTACPPGFTAPAEGQSKCTSCADLSGSCSGCSPGFFLTTQGCKECSVGLWSLAGETQCSRCQRGTYQNLNGQASCENCPAGKFMNELGAAACQLCPSGFFQIHEKSAACHECSIGRYSREGHASLCQTCPSGTSTTNTMATRLQDCEECPPGTYELNNVCTQCPESSYQDISGQTECKSCEGNSLSPRGSVSADSCFLIDDLKSYVFGIKGDSKQAKAFTSDCELRPNSVLLCPGCTCDDDARNGYWSGPICDECRRGFATSKCTSKCPGYDGTNDESMCSGNGKCWFGMHGTGLCYCGGHEVLDPTGAGVVVDVRTCPKGKICAGYGISVQSRTTYKPLYYLIQYRQFSAFVLQINKYTPARGHMWFRRFPPSIAYENICSSCVGPWMGTFSTDIGFWNRDDDYSLFPSSGQTPNGFHGENCQHECGLCLHGGSCNNVPHPYRRTYTVEDTFLPQRTVSIPSTTCLCTTILYDSNHMCCPNGFQPYVFLGNRHTVPYSRFTNLPHITSIKNEQHDWHINTDLWLMKETNEMRLRGETYRPPYFEPDSGTMYVADGSEIIPTPYSSNGPYNKHVFYGTARDICRACPGLFGKGVVSRMTKLETESDAEEFWWDNAMGALGKKCNGVGECDFYSRSREPEVEFMGSVNDFRRLHRGSKCGSTPIRTTLQETLQLCVNAAEGASFVAFSETYRGGTSDDMVQNASGVGPWRTTERIEAIDNSRLNQGWAEEISSGAFTLVENLGRPDTDGDFIISPNSIGTCIHYVSCETTTYAPEFSVFDVHVGHGAERLDSATFDRFDTCFTYQTNTSGIRSFGLYQTIPYENGEDPFLGYLCPVGHFCTKTSKDIGFKEACPVGYFQPLEGRTRTNSEIRCSSLSASIPPPGCAFNEATADPYDLVDKVCIRCGRSEWSSAGSSACAECSVGRVKKISGNIDIASLRMMNIPTYIRPNVIPWYYIEDEYGQEVIDCAMVPPGMIHIPNANSKMNYENPSFIAAVSCPFGMTSTPGTYMYDEYTDVEVQRSFNSYKEAIVEPYMTFEPAAEFTVSPNRTCLCVDKVVIKSRSVCNLYSARENLQMVDLEDGPDGCWTHYSMPGYIFYSKPKGLGISSPGITNICTDDIYRSDLMTQLIGQYCRYCPGNSMTGSESGLCTTCFANKLKLYLKESILLVASSSYLEMVDCGRDCLALPKNQSERLDYLIPLDASKFRNIELDTVTVTGSCTEDIILEPFEKSVASMSLPQCLVACSMTEIYADTRDEQPVANKWIIVGVDDDKCICSKEVPQKDGDLWTCKDKTVSQKLWRVKKFLNQTVDTNWFSDGLPLCSTCSSGKFLSVVNGACTSCPSGRYTSQPIESNSNVCLKCRAGQIAPQTGATACTKCETGKSQMLTGQVLCTDCPTGLFQDSLGSTSCKACPVGYTSRSTFCEGCAVGKFGTLSGTISDCTECPKGYSQPHTSQSSCNGCVRGKYQNVEGSSTCITCASGKFGDSNRQTTDGCKNCLSGTYSYAGSSSCLLCPDGYYQDVEGEQECKLCPGGTKCQRNTRGDPCALGKYSSGGVWSLECSPCKDDGVYFVKIDKTKCITCPAHHYIPVPGSNQCVPCGGNGLWFGSDGVEYEGDKLSVTTGMNDPYGIIGTEALSKESSYINFKICRVLDEPTVKLTTNGLVKTLSDWSSDGCTRHTVHLNAKSATVMAIEVYSERTEVRLGFVVASPTAIEVMISHSQGLKFNIPFNPETFLESISERAQFVEQGSQDLDRYLQGCITR